VIFRFKNENAYDSDMAIRLGKAFSTTPESWLNLQQQYDLWKEDNKHKRPKIIVFVRHLDLPV
jgi:plasmid maintenance system antidote protein VapI